MTNALHYLKKHPETFWLIAILAFSTLLRLAFLHEPFERDEGQYATIAQEILRGGLPYRDAIEIKPPGTFYLYALAIRLFGATTEAIRTFTAFYAMFTVVTVYGIARYVAGVRAGLLAALVYGVFSTFPMLQGSSSNTEVFLVLPLTAGVWFLLQAIESKRRSHLCLVGLCAAFALLVKPVALPIVVLELLFIIFIRSGDGWSKDTITDLAAFMFPILGLALATFGYFALRGGINDLLYWTVEFPRSYNASVVYGPPLRRVMLVIATALVLPALLGLPASMWFAWSKKSMPALLILLMIPAVVLAIILPGKFFPHYFITIVPFFAIPAGIGLDRITRLHRLSACLLLLAVVVIFLGSIREDWKFYAVFSPEEATIHKYGETTFAESMIVARYLREHTGPDDFIFQWGFEPELYFLSGRRCPNRYLVSILPGWSKVPSSAVTEMIQSLIDKRPTYIVIQNKWADFDGSIEIMQFINRNCAAEVNIEYAQLFRCK